MDKLTISKATRGCGRAPANGSPILYADTFPGSRGNKCIDLSDKRRCDAIFRGPSAATSLAAVWIAYYCDDLLLVSTDPQALLDLLDKALRQVAVDHICLD